MADPWLNELLAHFQAQRWDALVARATEVTAREPTRPEPYGLAAHALRQLGRLEEGFSLAQRGLAVVPDDLLVLSRAALLGNLTGRFDFVFELAVEHAGRRPSNANDVYNFVMLLVNAIHAAAKAQRIPQAVDAFSDPISAMNHPELHFNAACLYALAGDPRCVDFVERCLMAGKPVSMLEDTDLDSVRDDPAFKRLLERDWDRERAALARAKVTERSALRPEHFVDPSRLSTEARDLTSLDEFVPLLERAPNSPAAWDVVFDRLTELGDVRAEVWAQWNRASGAPELTERMLGCVQWARLIEANGADLVGPARRWWPTVEWNGGFLERLRVDLDDHELGLGGLVELPGLAEALAHPACRFVRRLEVRDLAGDEPDYGIALDVVAGARLPFLRSLRVEPDEVTRSWTSLTTSDLGTLFPQVEVLELGAGAISLGSVDLPHVRRFALRTTGLERETFAAIAGARWPTLEQLELWFGTTERGGDEFEEPELADFLRLERAPVLTDLALRNAEFTDALIEVLARSPALPRLRSLDLSLGTLTDAGASALLRHAPAFAHLTTLDLTENCLSVEAVRDVSARLPNVVALDQKSDRYVSVSE